MTKNVFDTIRSGDFERLSAELTGGVDLSVTESGGGQRPCGHTAANDQGGRGRERRR